MEISGGKKRWGRPLSLTKWIAPGDDTGRFVVWFDERGGIG
jgi:hypothetical protein